MGSNQSVLENKGYTLVSEKDNKILVKNKDGDQFVIKKLRADKGDVSNFLEKLNDPHIVHHKEVIEDGDYLYLVMEYCEGGNLAQKIEDAKKRKVNFSENEILDWTVKICMALRHLHNKKILHKNLQPKSLFFTASGTIRLGEFGDINEWSTDVQTADTKPLSYIAPENLSGELEDDKSEIWSLGCIIYEMCMQKRAFTGRSPIDIHNSSSTGLPFLFSENLRELVADIIQRDPATRPSVIQILIKPFVTQHLYQKSTYTIQELYGRLEELDELAKSLETVHYNTTVGSLAGGVVGLAGGITSIVGLILTPFTLGASLIVAGVGIGVAVAGGVASGASNITKMVNQRSNRQNIKLLITEIQEKIASTSSCIQNIQIAVETRRLLSENSECSDAQSETNTLVNAGARLGRGLGGIAELVRLAQVASIGRTAAQTARVADARHTKVHHIRAQKDAWEDSADEMKQFLQSLDENNRRSLELTSNVLIKRTEFEASLCNIKLQVQENELKKSEKLQIQEVIVLNKEKIDKCENFTITVKKRTKHKVPIESKSWKHRKATTCTVCEENCHEFDCWWSSNLSKCEVMKDGYCTVCTRKCHHSKHVKENKKYVIRNSSMLMDFDHFKKENSIINSRRFSVIMDHLDKDLKEIENQKTNLLSDAYWTIKDLKYLSQITLKPDSAFSCQHLDDFIPRVREAGKIKWVRELEEMRRIAEAEEANLDALSYLKAGLAKLFIGKNESNETMKM
ncbi:hypothetical protein Q8A67_001649 [Cirrhinus molitorella]|uniref:non-specific serine/threonine protein kinase n=1 Tax=Cirrhinus molitorella TaxID=172907 RepID=A0AA88QG37_9TELE|nr:hypothetical protein Q8A67_001649 [Cirrhinus molitorella]